MQEWLWRVALQVVLLAAFGQATLLHRNGSLSTEPPRRNGTTTITRNATATTTTPSDGKGIAFAESCQAALLAWSSSTDSYGSKYGTVSTSYYTGSMTYNSHLPGATTIHSLTTLCDGYPRVVGPVTYSTAGVVTISSKWTNTNPTFVLASYTSPAPCSIGPRDCELLYSSWTSHWHEYTATGGSNGLRNPPCETETFTRTWSTNSQGGSCNNCQVIGSKIRLLYWPVVTKAGNHNLCDGAAQTVTAAPTGDEPNTFVTEGITITSPSVAVSIGGLSRVDKCGTVVPYTVIPVLPEDVSSVQGARALFTHRQFNFADLNYRCLSDPDTIFMTTGTRTDCYQEVPASDYFYGFANAAGVDWYASTAFQNSTIWPNYQPQVLPPNTLTQAIRSLWGENCNIHPDGVWDPPIALSPETTLPAPEADCTTITYLTPTSTPAIPAPTVHHVPPPTAHTKAHTTVPETIVPTIIAPHPSKTAAHVPQNTVLSVTLEDQVFTMEHAGGEPALVNEHTTVMLDPEEQHGEPTNAGSSGGPKVSEPPNAGTPKGPKEPERPNAGTPKGPKESERPIAVNPKGPKESKSSSALKPKGRKESEESAPEVVTIAPGRYIVQGLEHGDYNVDGVSTTFTVEGDEAAATEQSHSTKPTAPSQPESTRSRGKQSSAASSQPKSTGGSASQSGTKAKGSQSHDKGSEGNEAKEDGPKSSGVSDDGSQSLPDGSKGGSQSQADDSGDGSQSQADGGKGGSKSQADGSENGSQSEANSNGNGSNAESSGRSQNQDDDQPETNAASDRTEHFGLLMCLVVTCFGALAVM
ncbi:uncharacterized protein LTR77_009798 [Saxophila tyrrhenica]|uniref:Uncharacterized protein n=1 Tax=Saxophila tyrrhenica TaxID=1690608 RepID=A0AAV9NXC5_9PEZI|nr:hypothetical protein LTR77_009798 [Saxophila tyrrhenica]